MQIYRAKSLIFLISYEIKLYALPHLRACNSDLTYLVWQDLLQHIYIKLFIWKVPIHTDRLEHQLSQELSKNCYTSPKVPIGTWRSAVHQKTQFTSFGARPSNFKGQWPEKPLKNSTFLSIFANFERFFVSDPSKTWMLSNKRCKLKYGAFYRLPGF